MTFFTDGEVVELSVSQLFLDPDIQVRERGIVKAVVDEYAAAMKRGDTFPPIDVVWQNNPPLNFVADGFHRVHAARIAGVKIKCKIRLGDRRAAILFAAGANAKHGLKRTNADKRRAVMMLLADPEWRERSDQWISIACGVPRTTMRRIAAESGYAKRGTLLGRDGKSRSVEKAATRASERLLEHTRGPITFGELLEKLDLGPTTVRRMIENARNLGHAVNVTMPSEGYVPHPQRGPAEKPHYIPEGHELGGVSRLVDADGNTSAEWSKTRVAGADNPPVPVPESFLLDRASVMRRGDGSTVVEWSSYKRDAVAGWEAIKEAVAAHVVEYVRPVAPIEPTPSTDADLLVVYPLGDPHIGMLAWANEVGESFDLKIAERELCRCMQQLVERSPASKEAIVVNLGDFWHAQDDTQRTPKDGNKLDVDGRQGKVGRVGLSIFRTIVDTCLLKHERVRVRSISGNHDPQSSFWLPLYLGAAYSNEPRVVVEEGFNPYQYDVFGNVLLGWAHGDGAKLEQLGEIMATDEPEKWGAAAFRYWNTGHVHHWSQKELRGCVVDTHRTLAGRDAWHHHSGYRSGRALKAVAYHRLYGLDSVAVVGIERVRAALGTGGK